MGTLSRHLQGAVFGCLALTAAIASAQPRVRFPEAERNVSLQPESGSLFGRGAAPPLTQPPTTPPPSVAPGLNAPPGGSNLGLPSFDPYSTGGGVTNNAPSLIAPAPGLEGAYPPLPGSYPPGAIPGQAPPALYPNGIWQPGTIQTGWPDWAPPLRLIQGPRLRYTWLHGSDSPRQLDINDIDLSVAVAFPNFLYSGQPIYVVPSFSLHLWAGPGEPTTADLPSKAYSGFLDTHWSTNPQNAIGGEVGVRVGVFSDFNTLTTDSLRVLGQGLLRLQLTPTVTIRGGVIYTDRLDVKLIPAGGVLWTPNPQTRFDVFFPKPKFSQYLTTLGNYDVWWYLAGEFGGDTWTIERDSGLSERIDMKDIRVIGGLEWGQQSLMRKGRRIGFLEAGWVLDREVIYEKSVADSFTLRDTFMVRAGIGY